MSRPSRRWTRYQAAIWHATRSLQRVTRVAPRVKHVPGDESEATGWIACVGDEWIDLVPLPGDKHDHVLPDHALAVDLALALTNLKPDKRRKSAGLRAAEAFLEIDGAVAEGRLSLRPGAPWPTFASNEVQQLWPSGEGRPRRSGETPGAPGKIDVQFPEGFRRLVFILRTEQPTKIGDLQNRILGLRGSITKKFRVMFRAALEGALEDIRRDRLFAEHTSDARKVPPRPREGVMIGEGISEEVAKRQRDNVERWRASTRPGRKRA